MKQNLGRYLGRPGRSLTRRLIWLAAAWIVVALLVTGLVLTSQFQESGLRRLGGVNNNTIDELVVAASVRDGQVVVPQIEDSRTKALLSGKYWAVAERNADGDLVVIARSTSLWDSEMPIPASLTERVAEVAGGTVSYNAVGPNNGEPLRVAASQKQLPGREQPVVFIAALNRSNIDSDTRQFATLTWAALGLLGVGLMAAVFFQVRIGLRPLYELGQEIGDVRKGRATRITQDYPVEIAPLAEQLNKLLDHNQEVVERQRTHVGNLAHALKTPLSVMLAETEGQSGTLPEIVRRQSELMRGQVDHHLRRARAAARAQGSGERTAVAEVLDEMAVMLERVFQSKGVEIDWRAPDELMFRGERQDLQEMVGNLLENACLWSKRRVKVSAGAWGWGRLLLVIEDDGPGLPEDRRDEVLKRGTRLDEDVPGTGLGLSIVDELTRAYEGRLTLGDSDMGGLKAMLELPAAES
ncbi:LOW QUALITY PROTEIN: sensor histidine kinase [Brevundimonas abyssalis TAR-001]|uniref:histidine kinase n=1 Tax=Brevundimonas abyssalis TAR-001 TaxID=1391729 RepID=A0A8E0KKV2_9CAUL|nr:LOW QUALITY PROTEIN: sensor histidine kinase [Brevundimonas abyssalis TAR-001]